MRTMSDHRKKPFTKCVLQLMQQRRKIDGVVVTEVESESKTREERDLVSNVNSVAELNFWIQPVLPLLSYRLFTTFWLETRSQLLPFVICDNFICNVVDLF